MIKNRTEAGKLLAEKLKTEISLEALKEVILLAIPRGGIIVGREIRDVLGVPLDCLVTKKIPSPAEPELAIGAIAEGGTVIWEEELCRKLNVPVEYRQEIVRVKVDELEKKKFDFRGEKPLPEIKDKRVILVDDGIVTGATIKAAIKVVRSFSPKEIIVVVPVVAKDALEEIKKLADKVVYLETPEVFLSLSGFFEEFNQIPDEQIKQLLL